MINKQAKTYLFLHYQAQAKSPPEFATEDIPVILKTLESKNIKDAN